MSGIFKRKNLLKKRKLSNLRAHSHLFLIVFLLLVQFGFYIFLCLKIVPYTKFMLLGNEVLSVCFVLFIVNSKGKNEFKLAWLLPVLALPIFGISMYFLTKHNTGWTRIKRKLAKTKKITNEHTKRVLAKNFSIQEKYARSKTKIENKRELSKSLELSVPIKNEMLKQVQHDSKYSKIFDLETYTLSTEFFPAYEKNRTKYYPSGEAAFPEMLSELEKAENFIFLDYFIIDVSEMWDRIFEILKEKAKQGVKIRVLFDSIGSINIASKSFCRFLKDNGIEAREFMPMIPVFNVGLNDRDHHKIMDIDGRICFTGGANLTDEYINRVHTRFAYWKDSVISVEGSAVISFTKLFLQIWHTQEKKVLSQKVGTDARKYLTLNTQTFDDAGIVLPYGDDGYNGEELAENVYRYILCRAKKYVHIITPYLILDNNFLSEMIFAAKRGIDVEILFPGHYDHFLTYCVGLRFVKILVKAGVKVYFYEPGFVHSKNFTSDDEIGTVGSINLDYRSLYHHFECGILLYKSETLKDVEADFQRTKEKCTLVTPEIFKKRVNRIRMILGWIARIFAPLM